MLWWIILWYYKEVLPTVDQLDLLLNFSTEEISPQIIFFKRLRHVDWNINKKAEFELCLVPKNPNPWLNEVIR